MKLSYFPLLSIASAHLNNNAQQEYIETRPAEFSNWADWHMSAEHSFDSYTPESFYQLHVMNPKVGLTRKDVARMYGLSRSEVIGQGDGMGSHDQSESVAPELQDRVVTTVMNLIESIIGDESNSVERTSVSLEEWVEFINKGGELPDFGLGPGHEYEFEEEYEKHHWLKYHANGDENIDIVHKEDIEHELLHHFHEIEHEEPTEKLYYKEVELLWDKVPKMFK
ncbi:Ssp120 protein [Martiniozyma asiatica (nom. inval.)]|nr:Ssp120 protein [Martiniozyma asiatica]